MGWPTQRAMNRRRLRGLKRRSRGPRFVEMTRFTDAWDAAIKWENSVPWRMRHPTRVSRDKAKNRMIHTHADLEGVRWQHAIVDFANYNSRHPYGAI